MSKIHYLPHNVVWELIYVNIHVKKFELLYVKQFRMEHIVSTQLIIIVFLILMVCINFQHLELPTKYTWFNNSYRMEWKC